MTTSLHEQRLEAVRGVVRACGAVSVVDLGCGDGDLLTLLAAEPQIRRIVGIDLSRDALRQARRRLDALGEEAAARVELLHGSMTEGGAGLSGFDCALLVETIEHIEPDRLSVLERAVFGTMRPATVVVTTPNAEFNPLLGVPAHRFREPDHRFEWGREKFARWTEGVARRNGYGVVRSDLAGCHPVHGGASQMAVFGREGASAGNSRGGQMARVPPLARRAGAGRP